MIDASGNDFTFNVSCYMAYMSVLITFQVFLFNFKDWFTIFCIRVIFIPLFTWCLR